MILFQLVYFHSKVNIYQTDKNNIAMMKYTTAIAAI